jgi:hypothetical protein
MFTKFFVTGSKHNGGDMGFRRRGLKVRQEENGKYVTLDLTGEGGKPVLRYSFPKDVPDRARKLRDQAIVLRGIAERLDLRASELEKSSPKGKVIHFLRRYLRKGTPPKTT